MNTNDNKPKIDKPLIKSSNPFPVVGIGASAGGLDAFKKLLKAIPENSGMAFVLVQHLHPSHESMLPDILQKVTKIPVLEISDDIKVMPDHIYIIPSNKMLVANDGVLQLSPRTTKKNERTLPVDLFFTSLAEVHQAHSIGVVLSGTASDGTLGLKAIKDHGGITFAQEEASAAYDGMPHSAIQAGVVDFILPPEKIPAKIIELTNITHGNGNGEEAIPPQEEDGFKQILSLLRIRKGIDFTYYKQTTIQRRILRRMALGKYNEPAAYLKYLRENKTEQDVLFQDILIPVTSFFRDQKSFDNLCESVFPQLLKADKNLPIRVWVAGCSTGEEVYSIAICLKEFLGDRQDRVQVFATDISEPAIAKARSGLYTKADVASLSEEQLNEFFTKSNGGYQLNKSIREMVVFAVHNFLKDPPFGKMDLISCRNVLIYLEPYLQKKALTTFHYALNPKGYLLLGKSETISSVPELFVSAVKHDKLFTRKDVPGKFIPTLTSAREQNFNAPLTGSIPMNRDEANRTDFQKSADDIMLRKYTPPGVVVNEAMDIVHFRGKTANYLEQTAGKPSHNLLKMAKNGLAFELRNLLHKAKKENTAVTRDNIPVTADGETRTVSIEAIPLPNMVEPHYLVLFHESLSEVGSKQLAVGGKKTTSAKAKKEDKDLRIEQLEKELAQLREDMRSITEDQEAANEELQSANEELVSGSEELQSLNEELETGKEELQSTNEELTVVNQELISMNEQATEAREFSDAVINTIREPILVLDKNLRIKNANATFYKNFQVHEAETEGKLIYELGNRQWNIPALRTLLENILPNKESFFDFEVEYHFYSIGQRTMKLNAREVIRKKGDERLILLAIEDITISKKASIQNSLFTGIINSTHEAVISKTLDGAITSWNKGAEKIFGYNDEEIIGQNIRLIIPPERQQEEDMVIGKIKNGEAINNYDTVRLTKEGKRINISITVSPITDKDGRIIGASKIAHDVTEQIEARKKLEESEFRYREMIYSSTSLISILKGEDMIIEIANDAILEVWGKGKDVIGKPLLKVLPEIVGQGLGDRLHEVYTTGKNYHAYELPVYLERNGKMELGYYTFVYQPQRDVNDVIEGVVIIATEATPQAIFNQKIAESEARFRSLIEAAPIGIGLFIGRDLVIENPNQEFIDIIGKGPGIVGKRLTEAMPELVEYGQPYLKILDDVFTTGKMYESLGDPVNIVRNGVMHHGFYNIYYVPLFDAEGKVYGILDIATDVTTQKELQSQIEYRKALLEAHNEASTDGILLVDAKGKILSYNKRFIEIWNMPQHIVEAKDDEAALAFAMTQLVHPQQFIEKVKWLYENPNESTTDILEYKDGKIVERHGYPVVGDDGSYYAWSWTFRDITEIKNAENVLRQSEENFRQLAELMPEKISTADAAGNITYYNESWLNYTGYRFEELKEWGWNKTIHPNDVEELTKRWMHSITTGDDFEMEIRLLQKNGDYNWHLSRSTAMKDDSGKIIKWITATTQIQHQREQREELEKAVVERTKELSDANDNLVKMNKELESFTYVASHDLQEPLRKIQTFSSRILEKEDVNLSDVGKEYFRRMQEAARRMQTLIEDLLSYSQSSNNDVEFEKISLDKIVEEVKTDLLQIIEDKGATIETTGLGDVNANPFQFRQLMNNLIGNALKFSRPGTPPRIKIESEIAKGSKFLNEKLSPEENYCHIIISDNGIGFDSIYNQQIFQLFQRLHGKEEYPGTGIGLSIVKKIVDSHNGVISAAGELNKGARFDIYIPVNENKN